jgi:hypothetical protein
VKLTSSTSRRSKPGGGRLAGASGLDLRRQRDERGEVLDEQRRLVELAGAADRVGQPLAEQEHRGGGRAGVGQADAAAEGEGQQAGDRAGQHDGGGQVADQGDAQAAARDLAQLHQVLVVEPVEALP